MNGHGSSGSSLSIESTLSDHWTIVINVRVVLASGQFNAAITAMSTSWFSILQLLTKTSQVAFFPSPPTLLEGISALNFKAVNYRKSGAILDSGMI